MRFNLATHSVSWLAADAGLIAGLDAQLRILQDRQYRVDAERNAILTELARHSKEREFEVSHADN